MPLEYLVGPVLALLVSMKFSDYKIKESEKTLNALQTKIELIEKNNEALQNELPKKVMATVLPVAQAVQKLNQQVGL
jgi:prefoldin subunit 5